MTLVAGEQFAGYTIVRQLGSGGMGQVYLAQHPRLPRRDALKVLNPQISDDDTFRQRFIQEADLAAALTHSHIVTVYDRGETDNQLWISTQFVDGTDAAQLIRDRYPAGMPVDEACEIVTAIAGALDYAHDRGLLHRDVKPANILLSDPDRAGRHQIYLADFGIARSLTNGPGLTATNFTLGTVAYAAPEQLMGNTIDGRADQYALAATAYHLLTGNPMFPASNAAVVIGHHLSADPPPVSAARPELAGLDPVLQAALAKRPQDRFATCTDFARAFAEQARAGATVPAAPTTPAPIAAPKPPQPSAKEVAEDAVARRASINKRIAITAMAAAAVATGVFGMRALSHSNSTPAAATSSAPAPASASPFSHSPPPASAPSTPTSAPATSAAPPTMMCAAATKTAIASAGNAPALWPPPDGHTRISLPLRGKFVPVDLPTPCVNSFLSEARAHNLVSGALKGGQAQFYEGSLTEQDGLLTDALIACRSAAGGNGHIENVANQLNLADPGLTGGILEPNERDWLVPWMDLAQVAIETLCPYAN